MPPLPGQIANVSGKPEDGSLAQLVEQLTFNQLVAGSNPARPTIFSANRFSSLLLRNFSIASQPKDGSLAQLVEQLTFNQLVAGSNPARPTNSERSAQWALFLFLRYAAIISHFVKLYRSQTGAWVASAKSKASEPGWRGRPTGMWDSFAIALATSAPRTIPAAMAIPRLVKILSSPLLR